MRSFSRDLTAVIMVALLGVTLGSCARTKLPPTAPVGTSATGQIMFEPSASLEPQPPPSVPGEAIVVLRQGYDLKGFLMHESLNQVAMVTVGSTTYRLVRSKTDPNDPNLAERLRQAHGVESAESNGRLWAPEGDREPMAFDDTDGHRTAAQYEEQSCLKVMNIPDAQLIANGAGEGAVVAILDTGADPALNGFGGEMNAEAPDFADPPAFLSRSHETADGLDQDGDRRIDEAYGHGTHVAGIIHIAAPKARLYAIKVLTDDGWGSVFGVIQGLEYAVNVRHAGVINMSLGLEWDHPDLRATVAWAAASGAQLVASAGNQGSRVPQYPASYEEVLSVTAVDDKDDFWKGANENREVDLSAPGVDIISLVPKNLGIGDYAIATGTSMSAPWVSGAVALTMTTRQCSAASAGEIVRNTSKSIDEQNPKHAGLIGHGRVDFFAAVRVE